MHGILYLLTSPSGKYYVGQTVHKLPYRWSQHIHDTKYKGSNFRLYNAIRKYGPDSFQKDVIAECTSKEELNRLEVFWIDLLKTRNPLYGYNIRSGGARGRFTKETKHKMSESKKGANNPYFGKRHTEQWRIDTGEKLSGENNPMFGKTGAASPSFGKNLWATRQHPKGMLGKKHSEETRCKMSEAHKRRTKI